jgi:hypothetical protein
MAVNWGPHFFVPTELIKKYCGRVVLREMYDKELLRDELNNLGLSARPARITNLWYFRRKGTETWIKNGESSDVGRDFAVAWDTTMIENGEYQVLGIMNVKVSLKDKKEVIIARENVVNLMVEN